MPHELTEKKIIISKCPLILCNNKPFFNRIVTCNKKWIVCDNWWWPAQWPDQEAPKDFPRPNLHHKNSYGHCLVVCCWSDPLEFSESRQNHDIWEVRSANRWDALKTAMPAAGTSQQKGPNSSPWQCPTNHTVHTPRCKSWTNWAMKFCLIHHIHLTSHQLRASWAYHFFKHLDNNFFQGKCFHNEQEAENAFQEFVESGSVDFYTTGISKLIPLGKNVMVPTFINKEVFQPHYKDLYEIHGLKCFPCGSAGKESIYNAGDLGSIPGLGRRRKGYPLEKGKVTLEKGKVTHSSILAWKIPWTV